MLLRFVVAEGPREGEEILLRDSIVIGRKGGDLDLLDSKVSGEHAKIYEDLSGNVTIEDLGSSNGTYVNDIKISKQTLKTGDRVQIGRTILVVTEDPSPQEGLGKGTWQDTVEDVFTESLKKIEKKTHPPVNWGPFNFPIKLEFVKGLQAGSAITFGFGPRKIGKLCSDGLLIDPAAPDVAFELFPSQVGLCEIRSKFKELKINEKTWTDQNAKEFREKISDGDRLSFGQTVIVVRALKEK